MSLARARARAHPLLPPLSRANTRSRHRTPGSSHAQPSLLDSYDYGMCGKVFRYDHTEENKVSIIASFGGLLMQLKGEVTHLRKIKLDDRIYALLRRGA